MEYNALNKNTTPTTDPFENTTVHVGCVSFSPHMPIPMGTALLCAIQKAGWKIGFHLAIVLHVSYVSLLCCVWHGPIPNLGLVT